MNSETRKVWNWWLSVALLIGVLSLLSGCAKPVTVVELEPWSPCYPFALCQIGQVTCSAQNQPVIVLRIGIDSIQKPFTMTHEMAHVRQMQGNCRAASRRYREDPEVQWQMELEAYCAEGKSRVKAGLPVNEAVKQLSAILRTLYNATDEDITCNWGT